MLPAFQHVHFQGVRGAGGAYVIAGDGGDDDGDGGDDDEDDDDDDDGMRMVEVVEWKVSAVARGIVVFACGLQ